MLYMRKKIRSEDGITLPELLSVFVIIGILGTVIISFLLSGLKAHTRIQLESDLRDEADIIMAELISDFYTLKASEIDTRNLPEPKTQNYYLKLTDGRILGFKDGKVHLKDRSTVSLTRNNIHLAKGTKIVEEDREKGLYHISLVLKTDFEDQRLKTESTIAIIKD